jgi:hypothetical protein
MAGDTPNQRPAEKSRTTSQKQTPSQTQPRTPPVVPTVPVELGWVENYVPVLTSLEFNDLPTCSINARQFDAFLNLRSSGYVRSPLPDTVNTHVRPQNAGAPSLVSHASADMPLTCPPLPALELVVPHSELDISLNHAGKHAKKIDIFRGGTGGLEGGDGFDYINTATLRSSAELSSSSSSSMNALLLGGMDLASLWVLPFFVVG